MNYIRGSVSLVPQQDGADCQGNNGLLLFLIGVSYQGVTFCDVTNNLCVSTPDLRASGLHIGPFSHKLHDDVLDLTAFIPLREQVVLPMPSLVSGPAAIIGSL